MVTTRGNTVSVPAELLPAPRTRPARTREQILEDLAKQKERKEQREEERQKKAERLAALENKMAEEDELARARLESGQDAMCELIVLCLGFGLPHSFY